MAGNLPAVSAEVVVAANQTPGRNAAGATLLSYTTGRSGTGFSMWNPKSLHITLAGSEFDTGLNVDDGASHRLTMSWRSASGALSLFDNGREVWRQQGVNTNGTVGGNGRLVVGQDQIPRAGGLVSYLHGYQGNLISVSMANRAINAAQAAAGGLHNLMAAGSGLLTHVVMGPNGLPVDTTGRATYTKAGDVSAQGTPVDTRLYLDSNCR
jgi:large repetitive protein